MLGALDSWDEWSEGNANKYRSTRQAIYWQQNGAGEKIDLNV
jgi:hypothetical protein